MKLQKKLPPDVKEVIDQIAQGYQPEKIILFGSYAAGTPQKYSDVDLAIIKKTGDRFIDRIHRASSYVKSWRGTDILVYTPQEWRRFLKEGHYFIREIAASGRIVYEQS